MKLKGHGLRISALLLGANAFVLLVPLLSIVALRFYEIGSADRKAADCAGDCRR